MKRTNTKRAMWKGRPGETYDLLAAASRPLGARVNVHRWLDTGMVEVRAIRGDGRTPDFREYSNQTLEKPTPHEIALAVHHALQALADARERNWEGGMTTAQRLAAAKREVP